MNLFIGGNFINTFGNKVDILQLIRQVTEDDDTIQSEVLDVIEREHGDEYSDLENADDKYAAIQDDVLYVDGATVRLIFSDLFDADYDLVVSRIADAIDNQTGSTLRLESNGFPEPIEEPKGGSMVYPGGDGGFTQPKAPATPATELFRDTPEWMGVPAEKSPAPAQIAPSMEYDGTHLPIDGKLPELTFGGNPIAVLQDDDGELQYSISDLYFAAYGHTISVEYLGPLISRRRFDLEDLEYQVTVKNGTVFASAQVLAVLHPDLSPVVEWVPVVASIVAVYEDQFTGLVEVKIDLFGNLQ